MPGRNRGPERGCGQAPNTQGPAEGRGPQASLTCFVGSAQLPNVFVAAGGKDLNQAGFIGASPLGEHKEPGSLHLPHWHSGERTGAMPLPYPQGPMPNNRRHSQRHTPGATAAASSQAPFHSPRKVPDNDSDMTMSTDHRKVHPHSTHQETKPERYSDWSKATQ